MKDISLGGFIAHLAGVKMAAEHGAHSALDRAARVIKAEAKREIGHYQGAAGPFAPWAELADSTKDERVRLGFSENDPGLRTGAMRDSIGHVVRGHEAVIGSDDEHMVYFELGTSKQPPRSALGGAAVRKSEQVARILGGGVVTALVGSGVHEGRMRIED